MASWESKYYKNMSHQLKIKIEQIAFTSSNPELTKRRLSVLLGMDEWTVDQVRTKGVINNNLGRLVQVENLANLSFNYAAGLEFEVLEYIEGNNWLSERGKPLCKRETLGWPDLSHVGMHCTAEELEQWTSHFKDKGVGILQDVTTLSHTNPFLIECGRKYRYVIFHTEELLGFDFKLIVRIPGPNEPQPSPQA